MKLVTSAEMRAIDREAIEHHGIPGPVLMENAGRALADFILEVLVEQPDKFRCAIICGKGNNGGDGFVAARHLKQAGVAVAVYFIGPLDKLSADAKLNHGRLSEAGLRAVPLAAATDLPDTLDCDVIVDAIFGTGFSGEPEGLAADLIDYFNEQESQVLSVDLPSGLNADTGRHEGSVVSADFTVTLGLPKYGLYLSPGREAAGVVTVVPIGLPDEAIEKLQLRHEVLMPWVVAETLPERKPDGHKGDFGKLLVVAGSTGYTGAATLTALSALRSGCGLVKLACAKSIQPMLAIKLTEAMAVPLPDVALKGALALRSLGELRKLTEEHDAVVIGPGLGQHHETRELVRRYAGALDKPVLIDADGLNAFAGNAELLKTRGGHGSLILTPHPGEFARLFGKTVPEDIQERIALAKETAREYNVVLVLKGSPTIVAAPDDRCWLNPTGNSGMATGGSGDVLSGMIGSFLAQGLPALEAALCGVFLHGAAGDIAADELTPRAMIAGDIIECLPKAFLSVE